MRSPQFKRCTRCAGSGRITEWYGSARLIKICPTCKGAGQVNAEKPKKLQ